MLESPGCCRTSASHQSPSIIACNSMGHVYEHSYSSEKVRGGAGNGWMASFVGCRRRRSVEHSRFLKQKGNKIWSYWRETGRSNICTYSNIKNRHCFQVRDLIVYLQDLANHLRRPTTPESEYLNVIESVLLSAIDTPMEGAFSRLADAQVDLESTKMHLKSTWLGFRKRSAFSKPDTSPIGRGHSLTKRSWKLPVSKRILIIC